MCLNGVLGKNSRVESKRRQFFGYFCENYCQFVSQFVTTDSNATNKMKKWNCFINLVPLCLLRAVSQEFFGKCCISSSFNSLKSVSTFLSSKRFNIPFSTPFILQNASIARTIENAVNLFENNKSIHRTIEQFSIDF